MPVAHAVFVVDAYTKRILQRHGWVEEKTRYEKLQDLVQRQMAADAAQYNELHAFFVQVGKNWCRRTEALCAQCPLESFLREQR